LNFSVTWTSRQGVFKQTEVRYPYEAGAIVRARVWSDSAGKFHQKAALIEVGDDSITLRKPDKTEIKVAIAKLSDADQQFVKSLHKDTGPVLDHPPQPPPLEEFAQSGASVASGDIKPVAIEPDPLPADMKIKQGGVGLPSDDRWDCIGGVMAVGGKENWLLSTIESDSPKAPLPTRLIWASLESQKIEGRQLLPVGESLLDYHSPTHRLLTFSLVKADPPSSNTTATAAFTLWEVMPKDKKVKPLTRWKAGSESWTQADPWARIIDNETVLQRLRSGVNQELVGWDTTAKKVRYRIAQHRGRLEAFPVLSGGRKYVFVTDDDAVKVVESATGKVIRRLPVERGPAAVAPSEDGRKLAVLGYEAVSVWDLTNPAAQPQELPAKGIGTAPGLDLFWVGDDRLMAQTGNSIDYVLYSLKQTTSLWLYHFDEDVYSVPQQSFWRKGHRLREIVNQHLVYWARLSQPQHGLVIGAVRLPGPQVDEAAAALDADASKNVVKPGAPGLGATNVTNHGLIVEGKR
jgi:hypothetical protein